MFGMSIEFIKKIKQLKKEKNAIILGHNYMDYGVQLVSDFTGDSYDLAVKAMKTNADIIVFAGVYFMAEQAAALNPEKMVLSPDPNAGCTLSDSLDVETLKEFKKMYPKAPVVLYINTSIAAKAMADYIVTSSTAVKVVSSLDDDVILFGPDANLANYVQRKTRKNIVKVPPNGRCLVHASYTRQLVDVARKKYQGALLMAHPESPLEILEASDFVGSTNQMIDFARKSSLKEFIVATEIGMINALQINVPEKKFYPLVTTESCSCARCPYMAMVTLSKIRDSLVEGKHIVKVDPEVAERAKRALENTMKILEK